MTLVVIFLLDEICYCRDFFVMDLTQILQTVTEFTREGVQDAVLDIAVLNNIGDVSGKILDHLQVFRVVFDVFPHFLFATCIIRLLESRWMRIPLIGTKIIVMSLLSQEVCKQNMSQLMRENSGHDLEPVLATFYFCDHRISAVDTHREIIGGSKERVLWLPI